MHLEFQLLERLRQEDHFSPGAQGQPGQHNKTLSLKNKKIKNILTHPCNPSTWAEARES
jgi:hypothetical protein